MKPKEETSNSTTFPFQELTSFSEKEKEILLGNLVGADVESGNADMELILLLGSGTNKGRAGAEGWGSRRSFGIFAE